MIVCLYIYCAFISILLNYIKAFIIIFLLCLFSWFSYVICLDIMSVLQFVFNCFFNVSIKNVYEHFNKFFSIPPKN